MVDYCTAAQVAAFLGVPTFTAGTTPTLAQVEEWIVEAEEDINSDTLNSWKTITVTKEYHTLDVPSVRHEGTQIFMQNRNITTLSTGAGDKLEVWNGSEWEDYLTTRTEGRNNDYWMDEQEGILWIRTYPRILKRTFDVRLTYRFGEPSIPKDIQKACIRLASISFLQSDDKSILLPEGSSNIPLVDKTNIWQQQADKIMLKHREIKVIK